MKPRDAYNPLAAINSIVKREKAAKLRRGMTNAERVLWAWLRDSRLHGYAFRRQQIIAGFIVDFYCHEARLVVEVDGEIHQEQQEYDGDRDIVLASLGMKVLRFSNSEIFENPPKVANRIASAVANRLGLLDP